MSPLAQDSLEHLPLHTVVGGRYRVLRLLGRGGMGAVYEAENTWTRRRVALKVMRPEVARSDAFVRRFMQEAQSASQLSHPNIVDVLDMGEDAALDSLYIVQEFLTGHDLRAHLDAAGPMPVAAALAWAVPVMEALVVAHARGIVHRDLKPDNLFLAETARGVVPKLIDFGIAKVLGDGGDSLQRTGTGVLMGTPYYMAPEQAAGDSGLDGRADVWAMGVVLYEMLSGRRPYEAPTGNVLIAKILYEDPRPLAEVAPELPADLAAVVMGALQRDLTRRHPTMQHFVDALRACDIAQQVSLTAALPRPTLPSPVNTPPQRHADTRVEPSPTGSETFAPRVETLPTDPMIRAARRRRTVLVALGGALALGLALVVGGALRRSPPAARPAAAHARAVAPAAPVTPVAHPAPSPTPPAAAEGAPVAAATLATTPVVRPPNDLRRGAAARPTRRGRRPSPRAAEAPAIPEAATPLARAANPLSTTIPLPPPR